MIDEIKEVSIESISEKGIEINNRCFTGEDGNQLIDPLKEIIERYVRGDFKDFLQKNIGIGHTRSNTKYIFDYTRNRDAKAMS